MMKPATVLSALAVPFLAANASPMPSWTDPFVPNIIHMNGEASYLRKCPTVYSDVVVSDENGFFPPDYSVVCKVSNAESEPVSPS